MPAKTKIKCSLQAAPNLPNEATSRDGYKFSTDGDKWVVKNQAVTLNLQFTKFESLTPDMLAAFKHVILWYIENKSLNSSIIIAERFAFFTAFTSSIPESIESISSTAVLNFRSRLSRRTEWYLTVLRGFFKKWHAFGLAGIDDDTVKLLKNMRLRGNIQGEAVLTMDPMKGPYSDTEFEAINCAANSAYADGQINTYEFALIWLFSALGARPIQYASMKIKDYKKEKNQKGEFTYTLDVPRAKQRGRGARSQFKRRELIPQIAELLERHVEEIKSKFGGYSIDMDELPLFPSSDNRDSLIGFDYHSTPLQIYQQLKQAMGKLNIVSERTGTKLVVNPRRFRYTIGTRAAMEGAGEYKIAEILDHSDIQNVGVYVEARPEIIERIDKAIALQMAPLAQAFSGMLISDEREATRGNDPASRIIAPNNNPRRDPVGSCGRHGFCGFAAPIACYTCRNFQPWLDGPHEEVLDHLLRERDKIMANGGDLRIASVNDRTIYAVAEVVKHCAEKKAQMGAE